MNDIIQFCEFRLVSESKYVYNQPFLILDSNDGYQNIIAPTYFIEYDQLDDLSEFLIAKDTWYKISTSIDDYMSFYTKSKMFDIHAKEEAYDLIVKAGVKNYSHYKDLIHIQFKQENQDIYVSYTI
ncbi:MAG: hypothetical protein K2H06_06065 [Anaeroplasmataceae bacterium]|nr:hypothetical protein [Anaeroplasmataceae bacterium]